MLGPVVRQYQEASEAWQKTPMRRNGAAKTRGHLPLLSASLALKSHAAASLVAETRVSHSFHCCDPAPHRFISKLGCCSERRRIQQGEP